MRSSTVQQAAFAFAVAACSCKGNLSTSGAAATIRRAQAFNEPKTVFFQNGKDLTLYPFAPEYPALRTLGLIEILGAPKVDGVFFKGLEVALTSAGKRESTNWKREDSGRATSWTVPIARRQLREILGVRALPDGTSEVEFMWSWAPNAVGVAIGNEADAAAVFREESSKKAEQAYRDQFDHNPVDPLVRVILDARHNKQLKLEDDLFAVLARAEKVDGSRVLKAAVRFYRFDDDWHPSSKPGEDLKEALTKSEK